MSDKAKWEAIRTATEAQPSSLGLYHFTMGAEENAEETIHVERAAPSADYYGICLRTLADALCYTDNKAAQDFFVSLGVRF
jgi:hypothetical protein